MSIKTRWVGSEGAAFERVGMAFQKFGYRAPKPDSGGGAYVLNIAAQYVADLSESEALAIIKYALESSRERIQNDDLTEREIVGLYSE